MEHCKEVCRRFQRPFLFWDNLHANDYDNGRRIFLGPVSGRDQTVASSLVGYMTNPNCEFEANFVPLRCLSLFCSSETYDEKAAFARATTEWLPLFLPAGPASDNSFTLDDVRAVCDLFYLPWSLGSFGQTFIAMADAAFKEDASATVIRAFISQCERVISLFTKLTELENRELCYTLYRFMWDAKEEADLLKSFLQNSGSHEFVSAFYKPGTYRGGFVAAAQKLLQMDPRGVFSKRAAD